MPIIESSLTQLLLWAIIGYGLGSIPFGMVSARLFGLGNLRGIGSGNIGATNVLRTGNKTAAALTLIFDAGKGAAAIFLARAFAGEDAVQLAGLGRRASHCRGGPRAQCVGCDGQHLGNAAAFSSLGAWCRCVPSSGY